ncbi:MAG: RMD1 family protein [Aestuariibacter sp.]
MSTKDNDNAKRITIAILGDGIKPELVEEVLITQLGATRCRDAYRIDKFSGEAWLFDYGVLVGWDLPENDRQQLCFELAEIIDEPIVRTPIDHYGYKVELGQPFSIHHDFLVIPNQEELTRLALSHAFAQAAKLEFFEDKAMRVIQENAHISKQLAKTGKVALTRRDLSKLRGVLFDTSSDITLHFNLLDTPEFFWDYPELEAEYLKLAKYLDLQPRIEILNKKLENIQGLLDMLAGEQYHKHSAFLEWIIIILIAIDITIYFF